MEPRELLRRIDAGSLRRAAGETILSAVEAVAPADMETQLVGILLLKHGTAVLDEKDIRLAVIDSFPVPTADGLARAVGLQHSSRLQLYTRLRGHFTTYTQRKSEQLIDALDHPASFVRQLAVETRSGSEKITVEYGSSAPLKGYLHPYQKSGKDQVDEQLFAPGLRKIMVQMPTGAR